MATFSNKLIEKTSKTSTDEFICKGCDYICYKKCNWSRHIITAKHKKSTNSNKTATENEQNEQNEPNDITYTCQSCNKQYKDRTGLWRHNQKCKLKECFKCETQTINETPNETSNIDINDKDQLILFLIKQNSELIKEQGSIKQMMIEQQNIVLEIAKNGTNNIINTNSHNKAFNLNFFLNETCKDAMNIMDFVESIQLQLSDLENVGEKGYIEGISDIIVKNLKALDITQRPVHCTDKKRETIYVKDDNKWEKDDENTKMHKMIRKVQDKNFRMVKKFKEKYPDYHKPSSKQSDVYNNIIIESMGGRGDNDYEKEEKIIKKVSKEVTIDK
jgi:hypothetical protein